MATSGYNNKTVYGILNKMIDNYIYNYIYVYIYIIPQDYILLQPIKAKANIWLWMRIWEPMEPHN